MQCCTLYIPLNGGGLFQEVTEVFPHNVCGQSFPDVGQEAGVASDDTCMNQCVCMHRDK